MIMNANKWKSKANPVISEPVISEPVVPDPETKRPVVNISCDHISNENKITYTTGAQAEFGNMFTHVLIYCYHISFHNHELKTNHIAM